MCGGSACGIAAYSERGLQDVSAGQLLMPAPIGKLVGAMAGPILGKVGEMVGKVLSKGEEAAGAESDAATVVGRKGALQI